MSRPVRPTRLHPRHALALLPLLGLALGGASCPNNSVGLCEAEVRLACEMEFRCCDVDERLEAGSAFGLFSNLAYATSEGECIDRNLGVCKIIAAAQDEAVAQQRIAFDGDKANACVAALTAARDDCDAPEFQRVRDGSDDDQACDGVTVGLGKDGDACTSSAECVDGGLCEIDAEDPDINEELGTREGECLAPLGEGDDCAGGAVGCEEGLECLADDAGGQTCQTPPGVGDPCPAFICAEHAVCVVDDVSQTLVCEAAPGLGDPCDFDCDSGLFCNDTNVCQAQKGEGEACVDFDECIDDTFCNDGTCTSFDGGGLVDDKFCNGT